MAVQILNDMPDVRVHRGDTGLSLRDWKPAIQRRPGKAHPAFIAVTIALHALAVIAFLSVRYATRPLDAPAPIMADIIEAPAADEEAPPMQPPPMIEMQYVLPTPDLIIETESITVPQVETQAISQPATHFVMPPLVESVEYLRMPQLVYPTESKRRREEGTVLLRVLVDPEGRPAQIQVERSSGFDRLDRAARDLTLKALFRPHEVDGVAQAAQVLIPFEFSLKRRQG